MPESIVPAELLRILPRTVREELPNLPKENQQKFVDQYQARKKKVLVAYPLCLLYGMHYVYLEETSTGIWFWLTAGGLLVWWLIDLFRIPGMVKHQNSMLAVKLIAEVRPTDGKPKF